MSEIEIISWALVALFLLGITSTIVGWRFINKYEKLKLEFTTNKLEEFGTQLDKFLEENDDVIQSFIKESDQRDIKFHDKKNKKFESFLEKMTKDYLKHTKRVDELNNWFIETNTKIESRIEEFNNLYPQLTETNRLLKEEDEKIIALINHQFKQLDVIQKNFEVRFKTLNESLEEKTETTHKIYQNKVKEYSSEIVVTMKKVVNDIQSLHKTTVEEYRTKLIEHASDAELKLKNAVKSHSFVKTEEQLKENIQNQLEAKNQIVELEKKIENILGAQTMLITTVNETQNSVKEIKENKGLLKGLFK